MDELNKQATSMCWRPGHNPELDYLSRRVLPFSWAEGLSWAGEASFPCLPCRRPSLLARSRHLDTFAPRSLRLIEEATHLPELMTSLSTSKLVTSLLGPGLRAPCWPGFRGETFIVAAWLLSFRRCSAP